MVQSSNQPMVFQSRSELDEFLFAPVIDDGNGMTLSVLSMLARAGVDPRSRAAELGRLPAGKAIDALTSFIDALPHGRAPLHETQTVAARLAALLPRRTNPASTPSEAKIGDAPLTQTRAVAIAAVLVFLLMGAVWFTAGQQSLAQAGRPMAAASAAGATPTPLPHALK